MKNGHLIPLNSVNTNKDNNLNLKTKYDQNHGNITKIQTRLHRPQTYMIYCN